MSYANELDLGPLTWVKGEIDLALGRAIEAIDAYAADNTDSSRLRYAQTHLHQAHGALSIVGLDGVTQFSEALERLLSEMDAGSILATPQSVGVAQQGLQALRQYLDDIAAGMPNQPLKLLPAYEAVQQARAVDKVAPSDLFYPDLSVRPPRRRAEHAGRGRG